MVTALTTLDRPPLLERRRHSRPTTSPDIGVERQMRVGLVASHVDLTVLPAVIVDVAEQVALGVLQDRPAEMEAHRPER